jgi:ketosteroid isomerase-like protein
MTHYLICRESMKSMDRMREVAFVAVLLAMPITASARAKSPGEGKQSKKVAAILLLEQQWDRAVVGHDRAELDKLMDPDFVATDVYGNVHSRADYLNALTSVDVQYEYRHSDEIQVQTWGNTAIALGLAMVKAHFREHDISSENRYMRVYIKHHGHWYTVAEQSTGIAQQP